MRKKKKTAPLDTVFKSKNNTMEVLEENSSKEKSSNSMRDKGKCIIIHVLPESHRHIKEVAARKGMSITDLCITGINIVLSDNGEEEIKNWKDVK